MKKATNLKLGLIATSMLLACGCSSHQPIQTVYIPVQPDIFVPIQHGTSLKDAVKQVASQYRLSSVVWDENINPDQYQLSYPLNIDVNKQNPQQAIDKIFDQFPLLANVENGVIYVSSYDIEDHQNQKTLVINPISKTSVQIDNVTEVVAPHNVVRQHSKLLPRHNINKTENDFMKTSNQHLYQVIVGANESISTAIVPVFQDADLKVLWDLNEHTAKSAREITGKQYALKGENAQDFADQLAAILTKMSTLPTYAKVFDNGYVLFHQNKNKNDAFVYEVGKGRLTDTTSKIAEKFGWKMDLNVDWNLPTDIYVNVSFPIDSKNDVKSAIKTLYRSYAKLEPKFDDLTKHVIINTKQKALKNA